MFTNIYAKSKTFTPVSCKNTDIYPSASETKFRIGIADQCVDCLKQRRSASVDC